MEPEAISMAFGNILTNIALIHNNVPTIGLIGHPPSNKNMVC